MRLLAVTLVAIALTVVEVFLYFDQAVYDCHESCSRRQDLIGWLFLPLVATSVVCLALLLWRNTRGWQRGRDSDGGHGMS
jgi:hypothetical protein